LLKKNNNSAKIAGDYIVEHEGVAYPLSRKSNAHADKHYPNLAPGMGCVLSESEVILAIRLRRAQVGDICHVSKVPLKELNKVLPVSTNLTGTIIEAFRDKVIVRVNNTGCSEIILSLYRTDVILSNIENTHKVAYLVCPECGIEI